MAKDTGKGSAPSKAAPKRKTPSQRLDQAQRNAGSKKKGEFMDAKSGGKKFKGAAKEPGKRRK